MSLYKSLIKINASNSPVFRSKTIIDSSNISLSPLSSMSSSTKLNTNPIKIGFIGCGQVGSKLLNILLEKLEDHEIIVSRRQPDKLKQLGERKDVKIIFDNPYIALNCSIIFLLVQPIHFKAVLDEIKPALKQRNEKHSKIILISCMALGERAKLQADLGSNVIVEQTTLNSKEVRSLVEKIFENEEYIDMKNEYGLIQIVYENEKQ